MADVKLFMRVSTALCRKQTRVNAVPISLDAPVIEKSNRLLIHGFIYNLLQMFANQQKCWEKN